ncbi:MAG: sigma 54-interacting transcriptional regulator [Desulfovermiculus sp.]|nr:sigma 54-interacting transcriptional regulator [Desulfovermiculus sp.]
MHQMQRGPEFEIDSGLLDEKVLKKLYDQLHMYELIMDSIYNGVMVTDSQGYIICMNAPYGQFLGIDHRQQIGKHCTEVVEGTRMHIVAKTGQAEINRSQHIRGQNMVVQRIPIRKENQMVAVFGQVMFKDVRDVGKLANELSVLESKVRMYEQELMSLRSTRYTFASIVGESQAMVDLKQEAMLAAGKESPVLISGESGTGKEVFAQAIHQGSSRNLHPFVRINCAAIPKDLMESELFGYAKGAFTGALAQGKAGKFELAHQGTIFLDEIGELPLDMQPKLLRVLEEKEWERIGGTKVIKSDFRVIAATNRNLEDMLRERIFRKDLFYRLNVVPMHIPPLRERPEDVLPLTEHLLEQLQQEAGWQRVYLSSEAENILTSYPWPGNVRELANALERTLAGLNRNVIRAQNLPLYLHRSLPEACPEKKSEGGRLRDIVAQAEKEAIIFALREAGQNKAMAARKLGIHRTLLYKKMTRYGIRVEVAE